MTYEDVLENNRPIFIIGSPRSGTTLLRFILSSHPRIFIPGETGFIPYLAKNFKGELTRNQTEQLLRLIGKLNIHWKDLVTDINHFYQSLPAPTLRNVLDKIYKMIIKPHGAVRWGDKTPLYIRYIPSIISIFPEAQFIHLIRDGRDCVISAQNKWGKDHIYMDNYYLLKNWVTNVQKGINAGQYLNHDQYIEIHYENLVKNPLDTLQRVCEFVREDLISNMLDHTNLARKVVRDQNWHVEVLQPINRESVNRWKKTMTSFDQKMSDYIAGSTLKSLGYELCNAGTFSIVEWLKIIVYKFKYILTDSFRRLLYATNVFTLNRKKRQRYI